MNLLHEQVDGWENGYRPAFDALCGVLNKQADLVYRALVYQIAKEIGAMAGIDIPVTPDCHEAGISAPMERFFDPLIVDIRPGPEGKTKNFYFGQNDRGQVIFCYTPKPLIYGTSREATSEFVSCAAVPGSAS